MIRLSMTLSRSVAFCFGLFMLIRCSSDNTIGDPVVTPSTKEPEQETPSVPDDVVKPYAPIACQQCDFIIPSGITTFNAKTSGVAPGDVLCFDAAVKYGMITLADVEGNEEKPILITNCDGVAMFEADEKAFILRINNSRHFRLTGGEGDGYYGMKLRGSKLNGVVLGYLTTDFEVDHLEVSEIGFAGIIAKTDPSCDEKTHRENYTMRNVSIHNNLVHDSHGEGLYIGHSSFGGKETPCGWVLPHTIENIKVYNNIIHNAGWDGIQVSSATVGAAIYDNIVDQYGVGNKPAQSSGICIGGGTGGECYNNLIKEGSGPGISVFGLADNIVYNNIIVNPGKFGIFCDERTQPGSGYRIINNTIINAADKGILLYSDLVPDNSVINNLIISPHVIDVTNESAFIGTLSKSVAITLSNNYLTNAMDKVTFVNADEGNYALQPGSPVVDSGCDVQSYNVLKDYYHTPRKKGAQTDAGAIEQ